ADLDRDPSVHRAWPEQAEERRAELDVRHQHAAADEVVKLGACIWTFLSRKRAGFISADDARVTEEKGGHPAVLAVAAVAAVVHSAQRQGKRPRHEVLPVVEQRSRIL